MPTEDAHACARSLIALDNEFYAEHAASFSATRSAPWQGWERLAGLLLMLDGQWGERPTGGTARRCDPAGAAPGSVHVLDLACGNLRFERFLCREFPELTFTFHAYDSCPELVGESAQVGLDVRFHELDVLDALLEGMDADAGTDKARGGGDRPGGRGTGLLLDAPPCALTICFGFMHHVPGRALRRAVLDALVDATAPGGVIAVSFWRFMDDPRLARKARAADAAAAADPPFEGFSPETLEPGDHFLDWQDDPRPLRYCHHVDETEVDALAEALAPRAREMARFSADGASGALNRYLVLQKL